MSQDRPAPDDLLADIEALRGFSKKLTHRRELTGETSQGSLEAMNHAPLVLPLHAVSSLQYSSLISCPPALAARMIEKADIQPGQRRLDLEADTGNLIVAMADIPGEIVAVEINAALVAQLRRRSG